MARLRSPKPEIIKQLCAAKGWGANELAHWAEISLTTAYKAFNGEPMFRCKLADIAAALKVPISQILHPDDPEAAPAEPEAIVASPSQKDIKVRFTITLEANAETLGDQELLKRINLFLKSLSESTANVEPVRIAFGSVLVTFELYGDKADFHLSRAVIHFAKGEYIPLDITAITIIGYDHDDYRFHLKFTRRYVQFFSQKETIDTAEDEECNLVITLSGHVPAHPKQLQPVQS